MLRGPAASTGEWNSNLGGAGFAPGGMTSSAVANPWQPYFGEPMRELKLNPYAAYGRDNLALPDAYSGSLPYMTQLMIHIIKDEDLWPTKVVCPIRITESEMEVAWDEIIFNNHMLQPVPEEGISRLVTQEKNDRRDHYVRYGLALILEHGFMKTAKGQQSYQMNILQIRNATLETMYFGVIEALLNSKQYSQAWTRKYGTMARSGASLRGYLGDEVERYMIVQKTDHGFDMLDNKAKKYLRSNGVTPDTWILPEGTATFLQTVRPENRDYYLKGPEGPAGYKSALNDAPAGGVRQIAANSCIVYESKSFEVPGAPAPVDPLTREVSVGEYVAMVDTVTDVVGPRDYKSHMRDIFVYDERRDDFSRIALRNALKASCRFDDADNLWFPPGWSPPSSSDSDPFLDSEGNVVYVFGDMLEKYMPDDIVQKVAESVVSKYYQMKHNRAELCKDDDDCEDTELWATATELKDGKGKMDGTKLPKEALKPFYDFVRKCLPASRVFSEAYIPMWRKDAAEMGGFFYNTIGVLNKALREKSDVFTWTKGGDATMFGDGDWKTVRGVFARILAADGDKTKATASEQALTASTLDQFIVKMSLVGGSNSSGDSRTAVLSMLADLASALSVAKEAAIEQGWEKHFQFVAHKGLLIIADVKISDGYTVIAATVTNFITLVGEGNYKAMKSGVEAVKGLFASDKHPVPSEATLKDDDEPLDTTYPFIGAFDVPAANARFGGNRHDMDAPPAKKQRGIFGAQLARVSGTRRGPYDSAAARAEGWDDDESPLDVELVSKYNRSMAARYAAIKGDPAYKVLCKSVMLTLLHTPITETTLMTLIDKDIYFPFEFVLFRPRITHQMATGILLKAGSETGETLVGHADFQLTDDVVRKMHYGNFTLYSKTIVWKSDNVYLAENIVATGYVRGNDTSFNTLETLYTPSGETSARSIYCALVPVSTRVTDDTISSGLGYFNPMDVTGRFADNVPHLRNLDLEVGNPGREHYPGASFYSAVWRMNNSSQKLDADYTPLQLNAHNTLCFQGHQMSYNPASRAYDLTTLNTGHFGERIYPGCGKVRRMANAKYLMPVSYTSAFGAQSHLVSLGA